MRLFVTPLLALAGCQEIDPPAASGAPTVNTCAVTDYGGGILLFTNCDTGFPNALAAYVKDHPTQEIVTFGVIPNTESQSQIHGYLVVTRPL